MAAIMASIRAIDETVRRLWARGIPGHRDLDVAMRSLGCAARYSALKSGGRTSIP
jgi:hypothetical protein